MKNLLTAITLSASAVMSLPAHANPDMASVARAVDEQQAAIASLTPEQQNLFIDVKSGDVIRVSEDGKQITPVSKDELARIFPAPSAQGAKTEPTLATDEPEAFRGGRGGGGFRGGPGFGVGGFRGGPGFGRGGGYRPGPGYGRGYPGPGYGGGYNPGYGGGYYGGGYYNDGRQYVPYLPCVIPFFFGC